MRRNCRALLPLLMFCGAPLCLAQTEIEDRNTQRNHMHSCPLGRFVSGANVGRNLLLCTTASLDASSEIVDAGTQSHGMHACPEGSVMTGLEVNRNQLACTHLNAPLIPRLVDTGGPHDLGTQRRGMHACPPGQPLSGIQVAKNLNLCGDQYVVRVNGIKIVGVEEPNVPFSVTWDVTCTDPACSVTLTKVADNGQTIFTLALKPDRYVSSVADQVSDLHQPVVIYTYTISASAGGGTDAQSVTTQLRQ